MNSKTRRILFLSGALLAALIVVSAFLRRGRENQGDVAAGTEKKNSLTALTPGARRPTARKMENGAGDRPFVAPVEVSPRALVSGQVMLAVSPEQIEPVLDRLGRSPDGLIAAQAIFGDHRYLIEAAEQHPDDPQVQFWILANNVLPADRSQWLEKFKQTDPDNSLPNYLAAQEAFRAEDYVTGLEELRAAADKEFHDYSDNLRQQVGELYGATGRFESDSVRYASSQATATPHIEYIQEVSQRVLDQQRRLRESGEADAADELAELGLNMLETVSSHQGANTIESHTLMLFMQERFLRTGDQKERLLQRTAERERIGQLGVQVGQIFARENLLDSSQLDGYAYRLHDVGEVAAAEWLVEQVGDLPGLEE